MDIFEKVEEDEGIAYTKVTSIKESKLKTGFNINTNIHEFIQKLNEDEINYYIFRILDSNLLDSDIISTKYNDYDKKLNIGLYVYLGQNVNDLYGTLTDFSTIIDDIPDSFAIIKTLNETTYNNLYTIYGNEAKISDGLMTEIMFEGYWLVIDLFYLSSPIITPLETFSTSATYSQRQNLKQSAARIIRNSPPRSSSSNVAESIMQASDNTELTYSQALSLQQALYEQDIDESLQQALHEEDIETTF